MPIDRSARTDTRQRRMWQRMNAGLDVEAPLGRRDGSGNLYLRLKTDGGLEVVADELAVDAGDGIELTANGVALDLLSPGFLALTATDGTGEATVKDAMRTRTRTIYIENPEDTDEYPIGFTEDAVTITEIRGQTDVGTVTFNIEWRDKDDPGTTGTEIADGSDVVADSSGATQSGFNDATVPADKWLVYVASATASTPTKLWITIEETLDPIV